MLELTGLLSKLPKFNSFCSIEQLNRLVDSLRADSRFTVANLGFSERGAPIRHVTFGTGSIKALFVAFPHCNEPIGGLTVCSLLSLLAAGVPELLNLDVQWHIVPCIDPDGAILNEGWSQSDFTFDNYLRHFFKQELRYQAECAFPISHKRLRFDSPTAESTALRKVLTDVRPDFYFSLHNAITGGAFYVINRDIGQQYYQQLYALLDQHGIPLQGRPIFSEWCRVFSAGIEEPFTTKGFYDYLEKTAAKPEEMLNFGACSWEYLTDINTNALVFLTELAYVKHPSDGSTALTPENQRHLKLKIDAENKYIASLILDEWEHVKADINQDSPFYRKVYDGLVAVKDTLADGLPWWPARTRDILFNPLYNRPLTAGERFDLHMERFYILCNEREFVRLLMDSPQTPAIKRSIRQIDEAFDRALDEIRQSIDFSQFEIMDHTSLAKVQLGSGLVALQSLLD